MADERFLDYDPLTGVTETLIFEDERSPFQIRYTQDLEPLMETAQTYRNATSDTWRPWTGELHFAATIPPVIQIDLMQRGIWHDEKAMTRWLNSSEAAPFRTKRGRI